MAACSSSHRASPEASSSSSDGMACEPVKLVRLHELFYLQCRAAEPAPDPSSCRAPCAWSCHARGLSSRHPTLMDARLTSVCSVCLQSERPEVALDQMSTTMLGPAVSHLEVAADQMSSDARRAMPCSSTATRRPARSSSIAHAPPNLRTEHGNAEPSPAVTRLRLEPQMSDQRTTLRNARLLFCCRRVRSATRCSQFGSPAKAESQNMNPSMRLGRGEPHA